MCILILCYWFKNRTTTSPILQTGENLEKPKGKPEDNLGIPKRETRGKPRENLREYLRKTRAKPRGNPRKTQGKPEENPGKTRGPRGTHRQNLRNT